MFSFATLQNMPDWLQHVALLNPLTHFLVIARGAFLRSHFSQSVASSPPKTVCYGTG